MRRFETNRWWALILALVLSVAGVALLPAAGLADKGSDGTIGSDSGDGTINPPDPQGAGDPDMPSGSGSPGMVSSGDTFYGTIGARGVGDVRVKKVAPVWMKVRLALGALKYYYLRF